MIQALLFASPPPKKHTAKDKKSNKMNENKIIHAQNIIKIIINIIIIFHLCDIYIGGGRKWLDLLA